MQKGCFLTTLMNMEPQVSHVRYFMHVYTAVMVWSDNTDLLNHNQIVYPAFQPPSKFIQNDKYHTRQL